MIGWTHFKDFLLGIGISGVWALENVGSSYHVSVVCVDDQQIYWMIFLEINHCGLVSNF